MDDSLFRGLVSAKWVRQSFLYAAFLAAIFGFGDLRHHEPIGWIDLSPFVGWALPIVGISLVVELKRQAHSKI
jgi:hypothetical protein